MRTPWRLAFCSAVLAIIGCAPQEPLEPSARGPVQVVCTTGMIADLVAQVGGEYVNVQTLCGTGVDPHTYKPTRSDLQTLFDADVVFYNGLGLEARMTDVLVQLGRKDVRVAAITEEIDPSLLLEPDEFEGHYDPHLWNDPGAWVQTVEVVRHQLTDELPSDAHEALARNADAVRSSFDEVLAYAARCYASIPADRRVLITSHDAFNYLGRAFDLEVLGIQGVSTDSEAGLKHVNALVDLIVTRKIPAVFTENISSNRAVNALVEGCAARGWDVVVGGEVFSDALGEPDTYRGTYLGMVDHNATMITRSLGGEAPEKGLRNRLD